jgi:hypothetical protein
MAVLAGIGVLAAPNLLGRGGDQNAGSNNAGQNNAQSVASSPTQIGSDHGGLTAQAAEQTIREVYSTAADGEYHTSYGLLSQDFKTSEAQTQAQWANTFADLQSIRFVEGPDAQVSGSTAKVTGVTIAEKVSRTERNTVTWRMVDEGAEWKLDGIPSFQRDIISG